MTILSGLIAVIKALGSDFKILSGNTFNIDNRSVTLNLTEEALNSLSNEQKQKLQSEAKKAIQSGVDYQIIDSVSQTDLGSIKDASQNQIEKVRFIQKNIPKEDQALWLAGIVLTERHESDDRDEVKRIKSDMVQQAGTKGANIANLCSAHYLEELIIPMHEALVQSGQEASFSPAYEQMVNYPIFAVFAQSNQKVDELVEETTHKIKQLRSSGHNQISLHGLGSKNVTSLKKCLATVMKDQAQFIHSHQIYESPHTRYIRIDINLIRNTR